MARIEFKSACPVRRTIHLLSGKWTARVIFELTKADSTRFGELRKLIPEVSATMLSQTLAELEEKNLVKREQFNEIPPHVEYSLTEAGKGMSKVFEAMKEWGTEYLPPVE